MVRGAFDLATRLKGNFNDFRSYASIDCQHNSFGQSSFTASLRSISPAGEGLVFGNPSYNLFTWLNLTHWLKAIVSHPYRSIWGVAQLASL